MSVRVHDFGAGISQLLGTGGRDLSEQVGGIMMIDGSRALAQDPTTEVIVLVSKPQAPSVEAKVLAEIASAGKPVVVCFLGGSEDGVVGAGGHFASSTKEAARQAVLLTGAEEKVLDRQPLDTALVEEVRARLAPEQRYLPSSPAWLSAVRRLSSACSCCCQRSRQRSLRSPWTGGMPASTGRGPSVSRDHAQGEGPHPRAFVASVSAL